MITLSPFFLFILISPFFWSLISKQNYVFAFVFVIVNKFSREFVSSDYYLCTIC